jgi:hypothetical protein
VLRRILIELKSEEVTGCWRKLQSCRMCALIIIRAIKQSRVWSAEHVTPDEEMRNTSICLVGQSERKRPLDKHMGRWNNSKVDLKK